MNLFAFLIDETLARGADRERDELAGLKVVALHELVCRCLVPQIEGESRIRPVFHDWWGDVKALEVLQRVAVTSEHEGSIRK